MDNSSAAIVSAAISIPFITMGQIVLAATACFIMFFLVKNMMSNAKETKEKIARKARGLAREIKDEADRLREESETA